MLRTVITTRVMAATQIWSCRAAALRCQPMSLNAGRSVSGKRHHHGGHREDAGEDVDPPREPGVAAAGQVLGPLEHRARHRVVARDLGEVEGHEELADGDDGPAPDEDPADGDEPQREQREDPGRRRDVAEGGGEGAEEPERAAQLLAVPEPLQVLAVRIVLRQGPDIDGLCHSRLPRLCETARRSRAGHQVRVAGATRRASTGPSRRREERAGAAHATGTRRRRGRGVVLGRRALPGATPCGRPLPRNGRLSVNVHRHLDIV